MMRVKKVVFHRDESMPGPGIRSKTRDIVASDYPELVFRFEPDFGMLQVKHGATWRFYGPQAIRFVECEEVDKGKK